MSRIGSLAAAAILMAVLAPMGEGQTVIASTDIPIANVEAVRPSSDKDGPAVEIISNRPIVPTLTQLDGPPRLVIDLPNAVVSLKRKRYAISSGQISAVRVDQYQSNPPVARIVVDLLTPVTYTWDAAGNRLMVRLRGVEAPQTPTVAALTSVAQPAVVPASLASGGGVLLEGNHLAAGSSVTAGLETSVLRLARGGEVRVCPGTTLSVTTSQNGRDLMLGMSTGTLEAHYSLQTSADSVLTPDFRILLAGPGEFDFAIGVDRKGNTCVRTLPGNTASAIVSELMGDGTYQVKPAEQVLFHSGQLAARDNAVPGSCGCPAPPPAVLTATAPTSGENLPAAVKLGSGDGVANPNPPPAAVVAMQMPPPSQVTVSIAQPDTPATTTASEPGEIHVKVEAPLVYRAQASAPPPPDLQAQNVQPDSQPPPMQQPATLPETVQPPPAPKPEHHGFFGKIKGFFAAIFR